MPKIVEITGKKSRAKTPADVRDNAECAAEIIIFPGVRYERTADQETADTVLVGH